MEDFVLSCLESRVENNRSLYARFLLGPFRNGQALTVASALRRVLLSEIGSIAIIALDIQGVTHEFSTIAGVRESVLELSLNLQDVVLRHQSGSLNGSSRGCIRSSATKIGYLQIQGPAVVRANDLQLPLGIECVDPTQHIASISTDGVLLVKFLIGRTRHFAPLKRNNTILTLNRIKNGKRFLQGKQFQSDMCLQNIIPLDSFSSPVARVNFVVEADHLSNKRRERVLLELWTNGSLQPRQAIHEGVLALLQMFSSFRRMHHLDSHSLHLEEAGTGSPHKAGSGGKSSSSQAGEASHPRSRTETDLKVTPPNPKSRAAREGSMGLQATDRASPPNRALLAPSVGDASRVSHIAQKGESGDVQKRFLSLYKSNMDRMSFYASDIGNLPLSLRTYLCLKQKRVHRLQDILDCSPRALLRLVDGNKRMFSDIKRCVLQLGLRLKD